MGWFIWRESSRIPAIAVAVPWIELSGFPDNESVVLGGTVMSINLSNGHNSYFHFAFSLRDDNSYNPQPFEIEKNDQDVRETNERVE